MSDRISGSELRADLLRRFEASAAEAGEAERIEALAAAGNRQLLVVIAQARPRSVSELAKLVARHQPNVSRGLSSLTRAGLVRLVVDGRTSVPTLTEDGVRKAAELSGEVDVQEATRQPEPSDKPVTAILCVDFAEPNPTELKSDAVLGSLRLQFGRKFASDETDLNELALRVLRNWWPMFYRRDDPFPLCPMRLETEAGAQRGTFLVRSLGAQVELVVRAAEDVETQSNLLSILCSEASVTEMLRERLLEPVALHLEKGRRIDRPLHSLLERLNDTLEYRAEAEFAKTVGALGLSPYGLSDDLAQSVLWLIAEMPVESTRLDFASAVLPETFAAELKSSREELRACRKTNSLERLLELKRAPRRGKKPWLRGKSAARALRKDFRLGADASVGGIDGLRTLIEAKHFEFSDAQADALLGYRGCVANRPVAALRDIGPKGNLFLLARAVGDLLTHDDEEAPITGLHSVRQAVGRAFAAEFLAPSDAVVHMIEVEKRPKIAVAAHFGVDLAVIAHQYENNA